MQKNTIIGLVVIIALVLGYLQATDRIDITKPFSSASITIAGEVKYYKDNGPVPGVELELRLGNNAIERVSTDVTGRYAFGQKGSIAPGTYTIVPIGKLGGLKEGVTTIDSSIISQSVVGKVKLSPWQMIAADTSSDGKMTAIDASEILQFAIGKRAQFSFGAKCGSDWALAPEGSDVNLSGKNCYALRPMQVICSDAGACTSSSPNTNFTAALVGDVNGSWKAPVVPTITVLSPNGGEEWDVESVHKIQWKSTDTTGEFVKISLTGTEFYEIFPSTTNDGAEDWKIPPTIQPGSYKLSASLCSSSTISANCFTNDFSDAEFRIVGSTNPPQPVPPPTITVSASPISQSVVAGTKQFTFANYIANAGSDGAAMYTFSPTFNFAIPVGNSGVLPTNCMLYDDSTALTTGANVKSPTSLGVQTFTLDKLFEVLPNTSRTITLKCDISSGTPSGTTYAWGFGKDPGQTMTVVSKGSLTVTIDTGSSGSLPYRLVSPGQNVELIKIRYSATDEDIDIKRVALQLTGTGSNSPINLVDQMLTLWDGTTQVGSAIIDSTSDTATSTLVATVRIPKGGSKIITVKGVIAQITSSGPMTRSGDWLKVDYDGNNIGINGNYGVGTQSGTTISGTPMDTTSNGVRIMRAYPALEYVSLSSSERVLVAGDARTLYKFKVMAKNGDVAFAKTTFFVNQPASARATKFGLYAFADSGYSTVDPNFSGTNNPGGLINAGNCYNNLGDNEVVTSFVEIYPATMGCNHGTTTLTIPSGESRWFKLTGSIGNLSPPGTSDHISVQMEGDAAPAFGSKELLQATYRALNWRADEGVDKNFHNDLIWSPRSTSTSASLFDLDWTNGYGVSGLPPTNTTVETISK